LKDVLLVRNAVLIAVLAAVAIIALLSWLRERS
jgi:hypothetical protein